MVQVPRWGRQKGGGDGGGGSALIVLATRSGPASRSRCTRTGAVLEAAPPARAVGRAAAATTAAAAPSSSPPDPARPPGADAPGPVRGSRRRRQLGGPARAVGSLRAAAATAALKTGSLQRSTGTGSVQPTRAFFESISNVNISFCT
jgi:hypothetical protein